MNKENGAIGIVTNMKFLSIMYDVYSDFVSVFLFQPDIKYICI